MPSHNPVVVPTEDGQWVSRCSCRWRAPVVCATAQEAEDANFDHMKEVERLRAHTRRATQSLKEARDYYRTMAEREDLPDMERRLWSALAVEIDHRLNDKAPPNEGQSTLF